MARSPFQGTFQPNIRPTVVTAPDAVVYLNGEMEIVGCPQCSRSFNVNKYITSIQTDLGVDSVPGSGSITLSIPRHSIDDFYFDGNPVITPMMEVEIYAKGYYLVEGLPQYYPTFWGIITEVTDNYSGGEHTVSLHMQDILKWFELCQMNVNAAWTAPTGAMGRDILKGNVFAQTNPYDIIFTLAFQSFGDIIVGTGSTNQFVADAKEKPTFNAAFSDMMFYWEKRFSRIRNSLLLYGTNGVAVRGDTLYRKYSRGGKITGSIPKEPIASQAVAEANKGGGMLFDAASSEVAAMKRVASEAGQADLWQSVYQTKLELANAAKEAIGFEFYMDVTGDIVFKPPFYNLDVISNKPVSWIQDIDIIDWDFSDSESEVVTQIILQGSTFGTVDYGMPVDISPFTSVTDYHLLRKYGWRSKPCNSEFLSNPKVIFYYGLDMLDRINSHRHRGSVTIPMRPELRLGFPIYVAPKDQIWYITGISHSIQFGSRATTTLTLTAKRSKFIAPQGLGDLKLTSYGKSPTKATLEEFISSVAEVNKENTPRSFRYTSQELSENGYFTLDAGNSASLPPSSDAFINNPGAANAYKPLVLRHPKTGRIVGYPNIVMVYTRPFAPTDINAQAGQKESTDRVSQERQAEIEKLRDPNNMDALARNLANREDAMLDRYLTNRYQYGLNSAGSYIYAHDSSAGGGVISELLLLPAKNLTVKPIDSALMALEFQTSLIRPISDERGFEVIGHFPYGRRLSLRDGRLVVNGENVTKASVDVQLALSGDLQGMLTAQSQGLTSVMTGYQDPASTLTKLTPDERQTAATINPDSKKPEFVDVGDNFVSTAVLGSPEQQGSPNVEASQLSRALTLMEMSVKDVAKDNEECVCLTGRQDLAFMNTGYQVKTLTGNAEEDSSSLNAMNVLAESGVLNTPINSGASQQAVQNVNMLEAKLRQAQDRLTALEQERDQSPDINVLDPAYAAKRQAAKEQERVVDAISEQLVEAENNLTSIRKAYNSEGSIFTVTSTELISKVDQFLTDLYKKLDTPHQEFEKAIRGDLLPKSPTNVSGLTGAQINPPSEFAPPFSEPNRYNLGDPSATNGAVQTNVQNIKKAWSNFGKNLRKNAKKTSLSKQISQDRASVQRLTKTRDQLVQQQASHAKVIGIDVAKSIEKIDQQIAKLQKEIDDNQAKLSTNV